MAVVGGVARKNERRSTRATQAERCAFVRFLSEFAEKTWLRGRDTVMGDAHLRCCRMKGFARMIWQPDIARRQSRQPHKEPRQNNSETEGSAKLAGEQR